mgnify:CR=1 FL=1
MEPISSSKTVPRQFFEPLNFNDAELVGGFSQALSASSTSSTEPVTNNCNGGNCVKGCGTTNTCIPIIIFLPL